MFIKSWIWFKRAKISKIFHYLKFLTYFKRDLKLSSIQSLFFHKGNFIICCIMMSPWLRAFFFLKTATCYCALLKDLFLHHRHRQLYHDVKGVFKKRKKERKRGWRATPSTYLRNSSPYVAHTRRYLRPRWRWRTDTHSPLTCEPENTHTYCCSDEDGQSSAGSAVRRQEAESDWGRAPWAQQRLNGLPGAHRRPAARGLRGVWGEGRAAHPESDFHTQQRQERRILQSRKNFWGIFFFTNFWNLSLEICVKC